MAREEHLWILQQGVCAWNRWREEHDALIPQLIGANLEGAELIGVDLVHAEMPRARLNRANLIGANLSGAMASGAAFRGADLAGGKLAGTILSATDLRDVNLSLANLSSAHLRHADLAGANLLHANLSGANLNGANLQGANLSGADLSEANLTHARLDGVNFDLAVFGQTVFGGVDLGPARGLESCRHVAPSVVDYHTLTWSKLPAGFLRGCGLSDAAIEQLGARNGSAAYSLGAFLHYWMHDHPVAERLYGSLQGRGIRCWLAPAGKALGDRFQPGLNGANGYRSILLLSEACASAGHFRRQPILHQAQLEKNGPFCLVATDEYALTSDEKWVKQLRAAYRMFDFRRRNSLSEYTREVDELVAHCTR